MTHRQGSAVRATAPFVALVAALALTLAPSSPPPGAGEKRDGSLDLTFTDAPPTDRHGPGGPGGSAAPHPRGALVIAIETGGAGDRAGFIEGDLIIEFESHPVNSAAALAGMIRREGAGSHVSIWVWRDGSRKWMGLTRLSGVVPVARLAEEAGALRDEVADLRSEIVSLRAEIGDLRDELAAVHDDVDSLRAQVARLRPRRLPAREPTGESPMR